MLRPSEAPVLLDVFCGSCAVSLAAKARGYRVHANDLATRAVIAARGLVANDRVRIGREDLLRLFTLAPGDPSDFIQRHFAGESLPARQCQFLDNAFAIARSLSDPLRSLMLLLLARYVVELRPMSNWGATSIIRQLDSREYDSVNPNFLRDRTVRAAESHPLSLLESLRGKINKGVFTGAECTATQLDAFEFLKNTEGSAVLLDPPYAETTSYERAMQPLDSILAGQPVRAEASIFSGSRGVGALDRLLRACRHVPAIVLCYGNRTTTPEELERLVARHRLDVHVEAIRYEHLAGLASETSREKNLELLARAGRAR
jgi:16S rRNA G966 N2-methylase RsmD